MREDDIGGGLGVVGDIGGTNARFALVWIGGSSRELMSPLSLKGRDYPNFDAAFSAYLSKVGNVRPAAAAIAVAGPVLQNEAQLTNLDWAVSAERLTADHGLDGALLLNDYSALAWAAPRLGGSDVHTIGPVAMDGDGTICVLGAGTGFGVGALVRDGRSSAVLAGEGGHIAFAPTTALEAAVVAEMGRRLDRVSVERLLSGPGLLAIYQALAALTGKTAEADGPDRVTAAARASDPLALEAVEVFSGALAALSGDFALSYGATGGVYIAGGIAPGLLDLIDPVSFRQRFEAKGRFEGYMRAIPTKVIVHPHAALIGAAEALNDLTGR